MYKKITQLSKSLQEKRRDLKRQISDQKETHNFRVVFPSYPFNPDNILLQSLSWGHNGFLLEFGKIKIIVDPGYDFLARCLNDKLPIYSFNTLLISHAHVDHYASASVMIEVMSLQGDKKVINVLATKNVFSDKVISPYFSNLNGKGKKNVRSIAIKQDMVNELDEVKIYPIKLHHSIKDSYGFIFRHKGIKIGYLSDTGYSKEFITAEGTYKTGDEYRGEILEIKSKYDYIKKAFSDVNILIVNINDFVFNEHSKHHLSGIDLIDILNQSKIQKCFITHMNVASTIHVSFLNELESILAQISGITVKVINKQGAVINLNK